jgi:hypothetical protein
MFQIAGLGKDQVGVLLEHAKHDGANKGKGQICRKDAQSSCERTKGHLQTSQGYVTACPKHQANNAFDAKKGSAAVTPLHLGGAQSLATWLKSREIKTLMSP